MTVMAALGDVHSSMSICTMRELVTGVRLGMHLLNANCRQISLSTLQCRYVLEHGVVYWYLFLDSGRVVQRL